MGTFETVTEREIEKFIIREPPTGEKDDYDSENSWISLKQSLNKLARGVFAPRGKAVASGVQAKFRFLGS